MSTSEQEIISLIGERLAEEIARLKLKQDPVAQKVRADSKTVRNWISGRSLPRADQLAALSDLGINIGYVLTGKKNDQSYGVHMPSGRAALAIAALDITESDADFLVSLANRLASGTF